VVAEIYREHGPVLRRFVGRTSLDPGRTEDVVQEVILRVWRQAPHVTSMRAYLLQTARNMLIDMHRPPVAGSSRWPPAATTTPAR
jgi:RNA polymerase sigma-70 factor (ECF subfamily)